MSLSAWRLRPGEALLHRTWNDQTVVFDPESGDTLLLDVASFAVLECLGEQPKSIEELAELAASSLSVPCNEQLTSYISELLAHLSNKGLVQLVNLPASA